MFIVTARIACWSDVQKFIKHSCYFFANIIYSTQCKRMQAKNVKAHVAYKHIQGGKQPDISLRVTSHFPVYLELRQHKCSSTKRYCFRVELMHRSKTWSECCARYLVQPSKHKRYSNVRIQFCKGYYGVPLQFHVHGRGETAVTSMPIVLLTSGNETIRDV